jgi:hypothetical protein
MLRWTAAPMRSSRSEESPTDSGFAAGSSCATAAVIAIRSTLKTTKMHGFLFIAIL